ncbi:penicillin acylase family protein [Streptomyces sp. UNOB3_S3]|uniref:penicillin acylase family protein n=1 Tax=Streptomyces sp. UNOB3_S3 TaxID=2871682 RepID=UPI0035B0F9E1
MTPGSAAEHHGEGVVGKDYANAGFGSGWAQATDQVYELAKGFVTLRGERSRHFGPEGKADPALSEAGDNLSSDLFLPPEAAETLRWATWPGMPRHRPSPSGQTRQRTLQSRRFHQHSPGRSQFVLPRHRLQQQLVDQGRGQARVAVCPGATRYESCATGRRVWRVAGPRCPRRRPGGA